MKLAGPTPTRRLAARRRQRQPSIPVSPAPRWERSSVLPWAPRLMVRAVPRSALASACSLAASAASPPATPPRTPCSNVTTRATSSACTRAARKCPWSAVSRYRKATPQDLLARLFRRRQHRHSAHRHRHPHRHRHRGAPPPRHHRASRIIALSDRRPPSEGRPGRGARDSRGALWQLLAYTTGPTERNTLPCPARP